MWLAPAHEVNIVTFIFRIIRLVIDIQTIHHTIGRYLVLGIGFLFCYSHNQSAEISPKSDVTFVLTRSVILPATAFLVQLRSYRRIQRDQRVTGG